MILALLTIGLPLAMALLLMWHPVRPWIPRVLGLAPLPGLLLLPAAWNSGYSFFVLPGGWTLVLDQPGALMLGASALLWSVGGFAAGRWLAGRDDGARFALWWLLTLSGSLGVFVAGDAVSFYALYALASLPAYGLITCTGGEAERRAGRLTLAAALVGEGLILAALVLLAAGSAEQGLAIPMLMSALPASPQAGLIVALVVVGFGLKIGLVPLHGWMPLSYGAGPLAATAVLSGATSKAGIIGLIRFLPLDTPMPLAGDLILAAGLFSAFYGAALGLTQANPRSVLAYSSISQLGQMAAVLGAGLAAGVPGAGVVVAYYAVYHVLTKGGLFLLLGVHPAGRPASRWQLWVAGCMALGFAGLPLTGGALGKLALKDVTGSGVTGFLFSLAAIGSTVLMLHFIALVRRSVAPGLQDRLPASGWISAVAAATLLQWSFFSAVTGVPAAYALMPNVLFDLLWPVAAGGLLAWMLAQTGIPLPKLQPGDASLRGADFLAIAAARFAAFATRFEASVRHWPAPTLVLAAALVLFVALQAWVR